MPKTKAAKPDGDQRDRRPTVLVLIGLCICLPHLIHGLRSSSLGHHKEERELGRLVWLETTAAQTSGLYRLDQSARGWRHLLAALGPHPPTEPFPLPDDHAILPAFRLKAAGPPQAIATPARVAPIFFQKIAINQASPELLMAIPGIGRRLATTIISYRNRAAGGIRDRAALMAVEGIGEKKAAMIEGYVRYE